MAFKDQTISAMLWSFTGSAGVQIGGLLFSLWLANLLDPVVYGLFAIPSLVDRFSQNAMDVGLGAAIVQSDRIKERTLSTIFWLNVILSFTLAGIVFFGAPWFALYTGPKTEIIYQLLAPVFIVKGLTLTQKAILQKALNFKRIALAEFLSTCIGSLTAIYLAYQSPDVYALIARAAVVAVVTSLVYWLTTSWRPKLVWESEGLKDVLRFSLPVFGTRTVDFSATYSDEALFPKFLDQEVLGLYNRSRIFINIPTIVIREQLARVLFPAFSTIKNDIGRMADIYGKAISAAGVFGLLPLSLIILLSPEAIPLFLNEKWVPMIPIAQAMALMLAPSFLVFMGAILLPLGKSKLGFKVKLIVQSIRIVAIVLGLYLGGLAGLLIALIAFGWIEHFINLYIIGRELEKSIWWQFRLEMPGWVIHCTCFSIAWLIGSYLMLDFSIIMIALVKLAVFSIVFLAMLLLFRPRGFMVGLRLAKEYHYKLGPLGKLINRL